MTDQPRISPPEALAAYQKTGLRPLFGYWCDIGCGCPLTALYVAETDALSFDSEAVRLWADAKYGTRYRDGFVSAVDGPWDDFSNMFCERWRQGSVDGLAVRQAIVEAGLMGVGV